MYKKIHILNLVLLIFLIGITFFFAKYELFHFSIILYLIVCFFGVLRDKLFIISLYVVFLPIGGLIPTENNLFGIIGIDEIINLSALYVILSRNKLFVLEKNQFTKLAISLVIIYLIYFNFVNFKNSFFGIYNLSFPLSFKRLLKSLIRYIPLIYLLQLFKYKTIRDSVFLGVVLSIILLVITTVFYERLADFHLNTIIMDEETKGREIVRSNGIFSSGDINGLGSFFVITIGFILSVYEKNKKIIYLFFILFIIVGVLFTASRTAIIGLLVISSIFLLRNYNSRTGILYLFLFLLAYFIMEPYITLVLTRFSYANREFQGVEGSRFYKWIIYLSYIFSHPSVLLWGIDQNFPFRRGVHNFFIEVLFNSGLAIFLVFIYRYFKIIILSIKQINKLDIIYITLPLFFISMTIGGFDYAIYFYIFLSIDPYINNYDKIKYKKSTENI